MQNFLQPKKALCHIQVKSDKNKDKNCFAEINEKEVISHNWRMK